MKLPAGIAGRYGYGYGYGKGKIDKDRTEILMILRAPEVMAAESHRVSVRRLSPPNSVLLAAQVVRTAAVDLLAGSFPSQAGASVAESSVRRGVARLIQIAEGAREGRPVSMLRWRASTQSRRKHAVPATVYGPWSAGADRR
jgi:hypothetical protein